jgi:hypothetical protein
MFTRCPHCLRSAHFVRLDGRCFTSECSGRVALPLVKPALVCGVAHVAWTINFERQGRS